MIALAVVALAVALGAVAQRISGIGITLVGAPALAIAFGPVTAVPLTNTLGLVLNLSILATTYRHLDWRRALLIAAASAVVIVPVARGLRGVDSAWLQLAIGAVVLAAIALILHLRSGAVSAPDTPMTRIAAGATAGALGAAAGLSGPPLALYAAGTRWRGSSFVPTVQGISVVINVIAVASAPRIELPLGAWLTVGLALVGGLVAGSLLAPRVGSRQVENGALLLSAGGAVLAMATGLAATGVISR